MYVGPRRSAAIRSRLYSDSVRLWLSSLRSNSFQLRTAHPKRSVVCASRVIGGNEGSLTNRGIPAAIALRTAWASLIQRFSASGAVGAATAWSISVSGCSWLSSTGRSRISNSSVSGPQIPIDSGFQVTGADSRYAGTTSKNELRASCNSARASAAPKQW